MKYLLLFLVLSFGLNISARAYYSVLEVSSACNYPISIQIGKRHYGTANRHSMQLYSGYHHVRVFQGGYLICADMVYLHPGRRIQTTVTYDHRLLVTSEENLYMDNSAEVVPENIELNKLLYRLSHEPLQARRTEMIKAYISGNKMSSYEAASLLDYLSFETDRLEVSLFALDYVSDPENSYPFEEKLKIASSKRKVRIKTRDYKNQAILNR